MTMRSIVVGILLAICASAAAAAPAQLVLRSAALQATIDLETGALAELRDLSRPSSPQVFGSGEDILKLAAGDFRPSAFIPSGGDGSSITLVSSAFQSQTSTLPLRTTITYRLLENRLSVHYCFEAEGRVALDDGLDIGVSSAVWDTIFVRNHCSGEDPFILGRWNPVRRLALNQVYEFHNAARNLSLLFPNPYHSLVTIVPVAPRGFQFRWHALAAAAPMQAVEPKGPPLASVLASGARLHRQVEIIVSHRSDIPSLPSNPIAYFSPWPNGYDQAIAMTFDDIPFGRWVFPVSGHDTNAVVEQYLIRLLEDHPNMKMGWIILPDEIFGPDELLNADYPPGQWWLAHGKRRMLANGPPEYLQWLRNIDRDSLVYGYEDRVRLGSHGYHHTPEGFTGRNFEFQSYDTTGNDSTFAAVAREFSLLGLQPHSLKWIRFPGFFFTRSAVESLIKFGYSLFDYWGIYDRLPWMQFYSEHGRIWGAGTYWEGDTPSPYDAMKKMLSAGKLCHTAGHPHSWFDGDPEAAYAEISQIFSQAESDFPNLGYLFPDEAGDFANETCDIYDVTTQVTCDALVLSFTGAATLGQTVVLEWPAGMADPTAVTVDGAPAAMVQTRGERLVITLPSLPEGRHDVFVSADLCTWHDVFSFDPTPSPSALSLLQNYPNPFNPATSIEYELPALTRVRLAIFNSAGKQIVVLVDADQPPGDYRVKWDGRDNLGRSVASGIYFCRLEAGIDTRVRKLVLLR
jgi:hypothetical protein